MIPPLRRLGFAALLLTGLEATLHAQSGQTGVAAPAAAANVTGLTGQPRGIRAVTRRTSMVTPGQEARALFTAGGINLGGGTAATTATDVTTAPAPVVAEARPEGLDRPEVRRALQQLAAAGDADAKRLLALPAAPVQTSAARPVR